MHADGKGLELEVRRLGSSEPACSSDAQSAFSHPRPHVRGEDTREDKESIRHKMWSWKALRPESWCCGLTRLPAEPPAGALQGQHPGGCSGPRWCLGNDGLRSSAGGASVQLELRGTHVAQRTQPREGK